MKYYVHSKATEQPYILNFLTYGGAIRCGGPKPTVVHDCPKRIAITLSPAWSTAGPRAETAYTASPFFRPPQLRAAALPHARNKCGHQPCREIRTKKMASNIFQIPKFALIFYKFLSSTYCGCCFIFTASCNWEGSLCYLLHPSLHI